MSLDTTAATPWAEDVLQSLEPIQTDDLTTYVNALAQIADPIEQAARPTTADDTPYGPAVDIDRAPDWLVPWLGQFPGVQVTAGKTVAEQRDEVRYLGGFKRGTVATMQAAIRATLTGTQTVNVNERVGGAYGLLVVTFASETPDPALTERVAIAQKAAGRFPFEYRTDTGWDINAMEAAYAGLTITDLEGGFADITNLEGNVP